MTIGGGVPILQVQGGTIAHGQAFTLTGGPFGTKSRGIAAALRDKGTAAAGTLDPQWSGRVPNSGATPNYYTQLRAAPFTSTAGSVIPAPHPFVPAFYGGCNGDGALSIETEWTVNQNSQVPVFPFVVYVAMYYRADPNSILSIGSPQDRNFKLWGWSDGNQFGYCAYSAAAIGTPFVPGGDLAPGTRQMTTSASPEIYENPDVNGHSIFWDQSATPFNAASGPNTNGWIYHELEFYCTPTLGSVGGGYLTLSEFGTSIVRYQGRTDGQGSLFTNNRRQVLCGSYWRCYPSPNNWRYYADHYGDFTAFGGTAVRVARVTFSKNLLYATGGLRTNADLTLWNNTTIGGNFWKGPFLTGDTVYAHVVCENGVVYNAVGSYVVA